jgi:hypothetical protein
MEAFDAALSAIDTILEDSPWLGKWNSPKRKAAVLRRPRTHLERLKLLKADELAASRSALARSASKRER